MCQFFKRKSASYGRNAINLILTIQIFRQECFPLNPIEAIYKGFETAEAEFFIQNKPKNVLSEFNRSGSCALVLIVIDDICYIANLGDSRALLSQNYGKKMFQITNDHKPGEESEKKRILVNGGQIYQGVLNKSSDTNILNDNICSRDTNSSINNTAEPSRLPFRIFPGKLSVNILNN